MIALLWLACSGSDYPRDEDRDRDGYPEYSSSTFVHADCDDDDRSVHPGADEVCGNGIDDDCDENAAPCGVEGWLRPEDAWLAAPTRGPDMVVAAAGDPDGDGVPDIALATPDDLGSVWLLRGARPLSVRPWREGTVTGGRLGYALAGPIDADGDGREGVVLGHPGLSDAASFGGGAIIVEPGREDVVLAGAEAFAYAGSALATLDDRRGVVIGAPFASPEAFTGGAAYVFGAPRASAGLGEADQVVVGDVEGLELGTRVGAADLDGDGMDEVIATGLVTEDEWDAVWDAWVWERSTGTVRPADAIAHVSSLGGPAIASACDADGDGRDDLIVSGAYWAGPVAGELAARDADLGRGGDWLACAGDLDGDARDEIIANQSVGTPGETTGAFDSPYQERDGVGAGVGDLDGDGFGDVVLAFRDTVAIFTGGIGW